MDKFTVRKKIRACRDALSQAAIDELSHKAGTNFISLLFPLLSPLERVMAYSAVGSEIKTTAIIDFMISKGIKVYLPCVRKDKIIPLQYEYGCKMVKGSFDISEPDANNPSCSAKELGLVIVPGVAFDKRGNRIGFGKGYYDKFLSKLPKRTVKAALCFQKQLLEKIPEEAHDVRMNYIITENEMIKI